MQTSGLQLLQPLMVFYYAILCVLSLLVKKYLHPNYSVYEEKHSDEKTDIRKSLWEKRQQRQLVKAVMEAKI